jgi:hypothetical protein
MPFNLGRFLPPRGDPNLTSDELERLQAILSKLDADKNLARGKLPEGTSPGEKKAYVRDEEATKLRGQLTKALGRIAPHLPKSAGNKQTKAASTKKAKAAAAKTDAAKSPSANGDADMTLLLSLLDEIRDAVVEVLQDEETLQNELLTKINQIVSAAIR